MKERCFFEVDFSIKATYYVNSVKEGLQGLQIINYNFYCNNVNEMLLNEEKINPNYIIYFSKEGYHTIYFKLKNQNSYSLFSIFSGIKNITSENGM